MSLIRTGQQIGRTIKNASRMRVILSVFAKHGFANLLERINLGRFLIERMAATTDSETASLPERVRMSFEELGPTFVKFGQLMASRPDLVPDDFIQEFAKLHDSVQALEFDKIEPVIRDAYGDDYKEIFKTVDPKPVGAASIAQVHRATLSTGEKVVLKVQRPGILQTIQDDLSVLFLLAELLETYIPEAKLFNVVEIVEEYQRSLLLETNFVVEANNIRKFHHNFQDSPKIKIPQAYLDLTRDKILVMEALDGVPLSSDLALKQPGIDPDEVFRTGFSAYLKMVFVDGIFHGDLHAGNLLILADGKIGLLDFGVVGRLNRRTQSSVAHMLVALSQEDYERMAHEYLDLAPFNESANPDRLARDLRNLMAPYFGLTMKEVNLGKILLSSTSVAAKHKLILPSELLLFFKSLVGIESLGRRIKQDFDVLAQVNQFAAELVQTKLTTPSKILENSLLLRETQTLLAQLPRQLLHTIRKINSPEVEWRFSIQESASLRQTLALSFNLLFLGVVIAALILSAAIIFSGGQPRQEGVALVLASIAGGLALIAFFNYIRK